MRASTLACTLLACLLPSLASATEGLAWQWNEGQERRFLLQGNIRFAEFFFVQSKDNRDLRVVELYVAAFTTCKAVATARKFTSLACSIDDVELRGAPPAQDANRGLVDTLNEWDALYRKAVVQLDLGNDGRIRTLDLEGIDGRIDRYRAIQEQMRLVMVRLFSGLELQLPKKGNDKEESWTQRESTTLQLPSPVGSFGGVRIEHEVTGVQESVVTVTRIGKGSIVSGETIGAPGSGERPRNQFAAQLQGTARFDVASGTLVEQNLLASAEPTASSALATGVAGTLYVQALHSEVIPAGAKVEPLEANAETVPGKNGI